MINHSRRPRSIKHSRFNVRSAVSSFRCASEAPRPSDQGRAFSRHKGSIYPKRKLRCVLAFFATRIAAKHINFSSQRTEYRVCFVARSGEV